MVDRSPDEKFRVLIVDDEHVIAETLLLIFGHAGYETRLAYSAEAAVEIAKEWMPHLAVIDVVLPKMTGIDFAILLRALCPGCKTLLFSGQTVATDMLITAQAQGYAFEIMAKPVHPSKMLDTAANLLAEAPRVIVESDPSPGIQKD
jgi:DNA-binding NtrC family response regulator